MDLHGIRDHVASLFIMLNQNKYILFRVECMVVLVTVLFLAMFIVDIFRHHVHSSIMKAIFTLLDGASDSILVYLLGVMQTAKFKIELFPVWMLGLIIFRYSIGFISGSGVPDPYVEPRNMMNLLLTLILNLTLRSRFLLPLSFLLAIQMLRSLYRYASNELKIRSTWHGKSSELISEYMRTDRQPSDWKPEGCNPVTMGGYKYLVYGEKVRLKKPEYVLRIISGFTSSQKKNDTRTRSTCHGSRREVKQDSHPTSHGEDTTTSSEITRSSLITLDKIWGYYCDSDEPNMAEGGDNSRGKDLKDISMAFALSRLLRARLEDVMLQRDIRFINRKLVKERIIEERDVERAFSIIELQLAFVNDYFNTRYPMVFWSGLGSLFLSLVQSVATIGVVCWLSVEVYKHPDGGGAHVEQGNNAGKFITLAFMLFLVFKEIWEMVIYLLSDWTRLLLVCMYVTENGLLVRNRCIEHLILWFFRTKITDKRWHGRLDQYSFVQSYNDRPKFSNLVHKVSLGMFPESDDGATLGSAIDIPDCIKPMILERLRVVLRSLQGPCSPDDLTAPPAEAHRCSSGPANEDSCLPPVILTLWEGTAGNREDWYDWSWCNMQSTSHVILVWHIATSICEMELAKEHGIDMRKPGVLRSLVSYLSCWCSSQPYLIDMDDAVRNDKKEKKMACISNKKKVKLADEVQDKLHHFKTSYIIANSLSRYRAYLLISKPDLIPDSYLVPEMVFQATVKSARDDILKGCDSLETRYTKLMLEAYRAEEDSDNVKKSNDVLRQGAMLGKRLLDHEGDEGCWEILDKVWTELLIHIAPTWNAAAHKDCLESGGEFITIIWALLWHCGIEKSSLWPEADASEDDIPAAPQDDDAGRNNNNRADEAQQAGADTGDHPVEISYGETEATEHPDAVNMGTGSMVEVMGTGGSEIEEASEDSAGATVQHLKTGNK